VATATVLTVSGPAVVTSGGACGVVGGTLEASCEIEDVMPRVLAANKTTMTSNTSGAVVRIHRTMPINPLQRTRGSGWGRAATG